jgi:predicted DNA binding CopG/RHH family protein
MKKKTDDKLDKYEQEILDAYERGELIETKPTPDEMEMYRQIARNTLRKDKRVNIRLSAKDLGDLQVMALEEGIPYQTLMSSILHKYVTGRLTERRPACHGVSEPRSDYAAKGTVKKKTAPKRKKSGVKR